MRTSKPIVVLAGYSHDTSTVMSELGPVDAEIYLVKEDATAEDIPTVADLVLYIMSSDSGSSSQLYSVFTFIHDHVQISHEYLLAVGDVDIRTVAFPTIRAIAEISTSELRARLSPDDSVES